MNNNTITYYSENDNFWFVSYSQPKYNYNNNTTTITSIIKNIVLHNLHPFQWLNERLINERLAITIISFQRISANEFSLLSTDTIMKLLLMN